MFRLYLVSCGYVRDASFSGIQNRPATFNSAIPSLSLADWTPRGSSGASQRPCFVKLLRYACPRN